MFSVHNGIKKAAALLTALLLLLSFTACARSETVPELTTDAPAGAETAELLPGVYVTAVFAYGGEYVEDGGDAACENIVAATVENRSGIHYQLLRFKLRTAAGESTFTATTLFDGGVMTVLSEEKTPFVSGGVLACEVLDEAPFPFTPSVHTESLEIACTAGFMTVRNLTDAPLENVYVYYKNTAAYGWFGGITYRVAFGTVGPDETVQRPAKRLENAEQVVFTTFTNDV